MRGAWPVPGPSSRPGWASRLVGSARSSAAAENLTLRTLAALATAPRRPFRLRAQQPQDPRTSTPAAAGADSASTANHHSFPADPAPEERLPPSLGPPSLRPATAAACGRPRPVTGAPLLLCHGGPRTVGHVRLPRRCLGEHLPRPSCEAAEPTVHTSGLTEHERERLTLIVFKRLTQSLGDAGQRANCALW